MGLIDLFELLFGLSVLVDVRVVCASQLAISLFDLTLAGIPPNAKDFVIVLKFNCQSPSPHCR